MILLNIFSELPCATSLIFDEAQGTCVRPEQGSVYAKKCEVKKEPGKKHHHKFGYSKIVCICFMYYDVIFAYGLKVTIICKISEGIEGFFCPEEDQLGPHGQKLGKYYS